MAEHKPITCPKCGGACLSFVTEYHQANLMRFIHSIIKVFFFIYLFMFINENLMRLVGTGEKPNPSPVIVLFVLTEFAKLIVNYIESKTHPQAICRDCGNVWLLDQDHWTNWFKIDD